MLTNSVIVNNCLYRFCIVNINDSIASCLTTSHFSVQVTLQLTLGQSIMALSPSMTIVLKCVRPSHCAVSSHGQQCFLIVF